MGIANIINTAGGGGGGGSEIITNLVNSVDGAGLRLANQGYISCADVSANRFGTNDFSVEFVLSQETNAINADIFISNLNGSNQAVDAAVIRWDVIQNDNIQLVFTNSSATETAYNFGYDPAPDLNEPTHYLVSADRSGNAVLYRNGAEIASVSIAASSAANVGNSGQPTVIGSPVNNFGVTGNVYRFRTYSKALSSDEAKNVFDRADVPTALVSNLLLDLDCAYANPTQSTVIQDRGPNNQDGTLNGTITQTNVIKQLNSTSARIGTSTLQPADGELMVDSVDVRNGNVRVIGGNQVQLLNAANDTNVDIINSGGTGVAQLGLRVAGSEKVTIASDGNIEQHTDANGIVKFVVKNESTGTSARAMVNVISDHGNLDLSMNGTNYTGVAGWADSGVVSTGSVVGGGLKLNAVAGGLALQTNQTTRVSIANSTGLATFSNGIAQGGTSGSDEANIDTSGVLRIRRDSGVGRDNITFTNGGTAVGSITSNTSATQYNTSSDYRLKENLEPLTGALDRLDQLPVYRFNFKADPDTTVDGFVAHEVQAHVPEAITGEKDAMKTVVVQEAVEAVEAVAATYWEEGDELPEGVAVGDEKTAAVEAVEAVAEVTEEQPDYQGIDQSKLVPLLVAAVKELKAKVETLENA